MASISFDVFGFELWVTLLKGLTLIDNENKEILELSEWTMGSPAIK